MLTMESCPTEAEGVRSKMPLGRIGGIGGDPENKHFNLSNCFSFEVAIRVRFTKTSSSYSQLATSAQLLGCVTPRARVGRRARGMLAPARLNFACIVHPRTIGAVVRKVASPAAGSSGGRPGTGVASSMGQLVMGRDIVSMPYLISSASVASLHWWASRSVIGYFFRAWDVCRERNNNSPSI